MNMNKMFLAIAAAGLIGAATPAQAGFCWFKCGGSSGGGASSSTSGGGSSSGGGATPVPEPEQMGLFAMGVAVIGYRMLRGRRGKK